MADQTNKYIINCQQIMAINIFILIYFTTSNRSFAAFRVFVVVVLVNFFVLYLFISFRANFFFSRVSVVFTTSHSAEWNVLFDFGESESRFEIAKEIRLNVRQISVCIIDNVVIIPSKYWWVHIRSTFYIERTYNMFENLFHSYSLCLARSRTLFMCVVHWRKLLTSSNVCFNGHMKTALRI